MRPRQKLIDLFSAFVQFEGDRFHGWLVDVGLRRSMQRLLSALPQSTREATSTDETFWALYWHQHWMQEQEGHTPSIALGHLSAYLQEPCYWAADRTLRKLRDSQYQLSDCFQMAIADVRTVLKRFKPDRGANLKTFANIAFPGLLTERLRQQHEADLCTNLGLLRRVSKRRFVEALRQAGLSASAIAHYQLAWVCFNALYVPQQTGTKPLPQVNNHLWQATTTLYNTERRNQLDSAIPDCNPELMERWLNQCAGWVRTYLYPPLESLNVPKSGLESKEEWQDDLTDPLHESLLTQLINQEIEQERQVQQSQVREAIETALNSLDNPSQTLLRLYYQQGLTQQQIMEQLQMSQSTVSRRLTKARESLLMAFVKWSQEALHTSPTPDLIQDMSAALEEWLGVHYGVLNPDSSSETADKEIGQ